MFMYFFFQILEKFQDPLYADELDDLNVRGMPDVPEVNEQNLQQLVTSVCIKINI